MGAAAVDGERARQDASERASERAGGWRNCGHTNGTVASNQFVCVAISISTLFLSRSAASIALSSAPPPHLRSDILMMQAVWPGAAARRTSAESSEAWRMGRRSQAFVFVPVAPVWNASARQRAQRGRGALARSLARAKKRQPNKCAARAHIEAIGRAARTRTPPMTLRNERLTRATRRLQSGRVARNSSGRRPAN